jgi:hypothetical protein
MAVNLPAWPLFTLAFHKSPSKLKITVCPSGVRQGFERKNASLSCADNKTESIKNWRVINIDLIAIGFGCEYTAIPIYCNTVYGK